MSNWLFGMSNAVLFDLNDGAVAAHLLSSKPFQNLVRYSFKLISFAIDEKIVVTRPDLAMLYYPVERGAGGCFFCFV